MTTTASTRARVARGLGRALLALSLLSFARGAIADSDASLVGGERHVGPVRGTAPFVSDDVFVGGATTWGIVLDESDRFLRVCEEAVGETPAFHARLDDGRILIGAASGLFVTDDGGCTYARHPVAFDGLPFVSLARPFDDETALVVATTTALYRSSDGGATFAPIPPMPGQRIFREVVVDDAGLVVVVSGFDTASGAPFVARSDDEGQSWHELVDPTSSRIIALAVEDAGRTLVSEIKPVGGSALAELDATLARTLIAEFDGAVTDAAVFAGARLVIVDKTEVLRETSPGVFASLVGGPTGCLVRPPGATRLYGCARFADLTHFLSSDDLITWTGHMPYGLVEERVCPPGTPGQARCVFTDAGVVDDAGLFDGGDRDGGVSDGGPVEPRPVCACESTQGDGSGAWPLVLLGLTALATSRARARRR